MHFVGLLMCKRLYGNINSREATVQILNYCYCWTLSTFYFKTTQGYTILARCF